MVNEIFCTKENWTTEKEHKRHLREMTKYKAPQPDHLIQEHIIVTLWDFYLTRILQCIYLKLVAGGNYPLLQRK